MIKSALGVVCTLLFFLASSPTLAGSTSTGKHAKKHTVKKKVSARNKAKGTAAAQHAVFTGKMTKKVVVLGDGKRMVIYDRVSYAPVVPPPTVGDMAGLHATHDPLALNSNVAFVIDQTSSQVLFEKNSNVSLPIASITKLMTAMVVVESRQNMEEVLEVTAEDIDREKNSRSRLQVGSRLTRTDMLHIALMSSENRAASALGRNYPGGLPAFVVAMNAKARVLGMNDTHYVDSTGLSSHNVASARDLAKLVMAAQQHPIICQYSTDAKYAVDTGGRILQYMNSNRLVSNPEWDIGLQKTGFINEAGRCMVMQTTIENRPVVMVFLDAKGKQSRLADAGRIRKWLEEMRHQITNRLTAQQS